MNQWATKRRSIGRRIYSWFDLSPEERRFILGILAIALLGLIARHLHAQNEKAESYQPAGLSAAEQRSRP